MQNAPFELSILADLTHCVARSVISVSVSNNFNVKGFATRAKGACESFGNRCDTFAKEVGKG
jgi:hypothetical protein